MHDSKLEEEPMFDETKELSCPYCDNELTRVSASTYTCQTEGCLGYLSNFMVLK